jgi:LmbE family N-acetylglucosaminyl deacetylase
MVPIDPAQAFQGQLLFAAPHMDDEVLACGGTLARLPCKERIHVVYATDGGRSPRPVYSWQGAVQDDLPQRRIQEAYNALRVLSIPRENAHFLGFPDGRLKRKFEQLTGALAELIHRLKPAYLFIPFRYDRHPDHLALNWAAKKAACRADVEPVLIEYFVYYRWRLLPGGDVRKYIRSDHLVQVDIEGCADEKERALRCFVSQTTQFYAWQERAILPPARVAEVSHMPELFLKVEPGYPGPAVFTRTGPWIRMAHLLEPAFKNKKEQVQALLHPWLINHDGI